MNSNPHETDPESLTLAPVTQPVAATSFFARHAFPILFLGLLGAAFSPIIVRLSEVGPIATAVNRMALPLPLFFALLWLRPQDRIPMKTRTGLHDFWLVVLSGAFFAADLTLWFSSVMMTSVANASMLSNMTPVFVVLGGWLLFKYRPGPLLIVGMIVALLGSGVMMLESLELSGRSVAGDFLAMGASVFFAGYVLTLSRVRKRVSIMATMAIGGLAATLILVILAVLFEDQIWPSTLDGWLTAASMVVFVQIGGQMLIAMSLAYVPAGLVATMFLVSPIISALVAWPLFNESITLIQVAGAAVLLAGLELSRRGTAKKE